MTAPLQLPGIDRGLLSRLLGSGADSLPEGQALTPEALADQLQGLADQLETHPDQLTSELQALIAQLLNGGGGLPETALPGDPGALPPFAALAQAILEAAQGDAEAPLDGAGQAMVDRMLQGAAETSGATVGKGALAQLDGRPAFQVEFLQASGVSVQPTLDRLAGLASLQQGSPPAGDTSGFASLLLGGPTQGGPIPSQNLLSMPVPQPVGDPAWGSAIGERLVWMVKGDHQVAELKITPPNLGPMEVKLTINHDQASVSFVSNHALVRDALEAAIPRLREMLAEQSLNLVQVDVVEGRQQGHAFSSGGDSGIAVGFAGDRDGVDDPVTAVADSGVAVAQRGRGLLDLFV